MKYEYMERLEMLERDDFDGLDEIIEQAAHDKSIDNDDYTEIYTKAEKMQREWWWG